NAVEWIGHRLGVGEGAVGSVPAAVGTAMPETLIAIVALIGAEEGADQVAIGAIVGAPFLLATLAMGLVGLFAYLYRQRREQGLALRAHRPALERDLLFFLALFAHPDRQRRERGPPRRAHRPTLERDLLFFPAFSAAAGLLAWGPPAAV